MALAEALQLPCQHFRRGEGHTFRYMTRVYTQHNTSGSSKFNTVHTAGGQRQSASPQACEICVPLRISAQKSPQTSGGGTDQGGRRNKKAGLRPLFFLFCMWDPPIPVLFLGLKSTNPKCLPRRSLSSSSVPMFPRFLPNKNFHMFHNPWCGGNSGGQQDAQGMGVGVDAVFRSAPAPQLRSCCAEKGEGRPGGKQQNQPRRPSSTGYSNSSRVWATMARAMARGYPQHRMWNARTSWRATWMPAAGPRPAASASKAAATLNALSS